MDDNKVLRTLEGDEVPLSQNTKLIVVINGCEKTTPAFRSRLGKAYLNE